MGDDEQHSQKKPPLPRDEQVLGLLEKRLGGSRSDVRCVDGYTRNCRIPGRLKRKLWVREGDIVIVEPWDHQDKTRGDIVFKYRRQQAQWLRDNGYLDDVQDLEEF
jgi:translation initiation factor 1A